MNRFYKLICAILALCVICCGCANRAPEPVPQETQPVTVPTTQPPAEPSTEAPTEPPTEAYSIHSLLEEY